VAGNGVQRRVEDHSAQIEYHRANLHDGAA